jgi:hypothetical protein
MFVYEKGKVMINLIDIRDDDYIEALIDIEFYNIKKGDIYRITGVSYHYVFIENNGPALLVDLVTITKNFKKVTTSNCGGQFITNPDSSIDPNYNKAIEVNSNYIDLDYEDYDCWQPDFYKRGTL